MVCEVHHRHERFFFLELDDDEITANVQDIHHPQYGAGQKDKLLFGQTRKFMDGHETAGGDVKHGPLASLAQELIAL